MHFLSYQAGCRCALNGSQCELPLLLTVMFWSFHKKFMHLLLHLLLLPSIICTASRLRRDGCDAARISHRISTFMICKILSKEK